MMQRAKCERSRWDIVRSRENGFHLNIVIVTCFNVINVTIWQVYSSCGHIWKLFHLNIYEYTWNLFFIKWAQLSLCKYVDSAEPSLLLYTKNRCRLSLGPELSPTVSAFIIFILWSKKLKLILFLLPNNKYVMRYWVFSALYNRQHIHNKWQGEELLYQYLTFKMISFTRWKNWNL